MDELIKISVARDGLPTDSIWAYAEQSLWEALAANGLVSSAACAGQKVCGKCKLKVRGALQPPDDAERYLLLPEEVKAGIRLACHIPVGPGLEVCLEDMPLASSGFAIANTISLDEAMILHRKVYLPGFDPRHAVSIQERLQRAVPDLKLQLSATELNELYRLDRADRPVLELNALVDEQQRLIYAGKARQKIYAAALDIGTTSLVGMLVDLESNQTVATATMPNMQRIYGDDIISRLHYVMSHEDGLHTLQQVVINNINTILAKLANTCGSQTDRVYRVVAVGNPVMTHLLLGLNPAGLAQAPFCGIITADYRCGAAGLGLMVHPEAELEVPPQAGGFVGADALSGLLTLKEPVVRPYMFIDIGTNSEVILASAEGLWAASAAAGPAFEGAGVRCGMKAASGAIDHFEWQDDRLSYHVLGKASPRGMCGSALIDLLACLLEKGLLSAAGNLLESETGLASRQGDQGRELIVVPSREAFQGIPVVLSQEDLRRLQLAKGAVRAATEILLRESGIKTQSLKAVYLAGGFGSYLNADNAIKIGLLPQVRADIVKNIGHAAVRGAAAYLLSARARHKLEDLRQTVQTIALSEHPDFQPQFLRHMNFNVG